jgi:hypothetical protein
MRRIVDGVGGTLLVLGLAACGSATPSPSSSAGAPSNADLGVLSGKTPQQILTAAQKAAHTVGSTHYVLTAVQGKLSQTISGDASNRDARQKLAQGADHIEVLYVRGVVYVQGDAGGLTSAMRFSPTVAKNYAGKWIAIHKTDSPYKNIVNAVTLDNTLAQIDPNGNLSLTGNKTVQGLKTVGVKGGLPGQIQAGVTGSTTIYVSTSKPTVPLGFQGQATMGNQRVVDTGTFTNWGKPLNLKAPTPSVNFTSVPPA